MASELGIAVIGAGYWGPNLIRNFANAAGWDLRQVCDLDVERAARAVGRKSTVAVTDVLADVLDDVNVDAVAIATPPSTHATLAIQAMDAGKHVMVEKPLATSVAEGEKMNAVSERRGVVLMCDHTYCYTPAVRHLRELISGGIIGDIQYIDSVRINLGLVQADTDVFWDLAPHDLSIFDYILPEDLHPVGVAAAGADPIGVGQTCVGYLTLPLSNGGIAHVHANWLSPTKIRQTIVGGSKRMVVWDDLNPSQRLTMYDKGVDWKAVLPANRRLAATISYRTGEMVAPVLPEREALQSVVEEFRSAIVEHRKALTDGHAGLRVLRVLEAIGTSLRQGGSTIQLTA